MALNVKANNTSRAKSRIYGILLALGTIIVVAIIMYVASLENKKVITVVKLKKDVAASANSLITEDMIEAYDMYYKEFEQYGITEYSDGTKRSNIVKWADRDGVIGNRYAAYYLRANTVLFWDNTVSEQARKNSYLYSMSGELLNIHLNTVEEFGDMVVPGDSLNIRATFQETDYDLPEEEAYMLSLSQYGGYGAGAGVNAVTRTKVEPMFEEVQILDMLNGSGQSVFDIYYEYIAMSKQEQQAALKDESFLSMVQPASILLEVTSEEVERYMEL